MKAILTHNASRAKWKKCAFAQLHIIKWAIIWSKTKRQLSVDNGIKHSKEQRLIIIIDNKTTLDIICMPNTWCDKYQFCLVS